MISKIKGALEYLAIVANICLVAYILLFGSVSFKGILVPEEKARSVYTLPNPDQEWTI